MENSAATLSRATLPMAARADLLLDAGSQLAVADDDGSQVGQGGGHQLHRVDELEQPLLWAQPGDGACEQDVLAPWRSVEQPADDPPALVARRLIRGPEQVRVHAVMDDHDSVWRVAVLLDEELARAVG